MITNLSSFELKFKDRKKELHILSQILESPQFEFIVIYGRRRIGKTTLVLFLTRHKRVIYYFAKESSANSSANLLDFYQTCLRQFPELSKFKPDYRTLFEFLQTRIDIIIIDEIQYLLKEDPRNASIFAELIDQYRIYNPIPLKLIVLGSSISLIKDEVLSDPSPLFGRKTFDLKLNALSYFDLKEFFPTLTPQELMEIYGFADGIPYYLEEIIPPFWSWFDKQLQTGRFLINEIEWLLRIEFREQGRYLAILEAIAAGNTTNKDLLNVVFTERNASSSLTRYLDRLIAVDFIKKEFPITENPLRSHLGRYYLADNFLLFWFRFIFPNRSAISQNVYPTQSIQSQYQVYLGLIFEKVVKQYLLLHPPFAFTHIGRWWGKSSQKTAEEIDLVAFDDQSFNALAIECKWQRSVNPLTISQHLAEKIKFVLFPGPRIPKTFHFIIFGINFTKNITKFNDIPVKCVTLEELYSN